MSSRRRTGALASGLNVLGGAVGLDIERRLKQEDADREFERKWQQAITEQAVKSGQLIPQFSTQTGQRPLLTGFEQRPPTDPLQAIFGEGELPEGVSVRQTIKTPQGTITITRQVPKPPKAGPFLPEQQTSQMLEGAWPGTPLPSTRTIVNQQTLASRQVPNIPVGPAGANTLNQAIGQGRTESPASLLFGRGLSSQAVPGPQGGLIAGQAVEALPGTSQPRTSTIGQLLPPAQVAAPGGGNLDPRFVQRIQEAKARGIPESRIAADLVAKGIDPAPYGLLQ